jgi:hypothetical protein
MFVGLTKDNADLCLPFLTLFVGPFMLVLLYEGEEQKSKAPSCFG